MLSLDNLDVAMVLSGGAIPTGTPAVITGPTGASTSASFVGNELHLNVDHLEADTRSPQPAAAFTVTWQEGAGGQPAPRALDVTAGVDSFDAHVDVGLLFYGAPITGGVTAPWTCTPDEPTVVLASTAVVSGSVSTEPSWSVADTTAPTSGMTTSTTVPATTTTWPSATTTPASACSAMAFDAYGGALAVALPATGFFRTAQVGGRWWIVDPEGHPFFSQGVNNVTFDGTSDIHGVSAYRDAATARYGTPAAWATAQLGRLGSWGYNTLGAWSDTDSFAGRMPYTLLLNLTSEDFGTGVMEDLWAPSWAQGVTASVDAAAAAHRDDAELVGYWSDNELHWGPDWRPVHLFDEYLDRPGSAAGKQAMVTWLQGRYATFAAFAADFTTSATSWAELAQPSTVTAWTTGGGQATRSAWVGQVAERYFSTIAASLRAADPHHLFLGPRMIAQTTGTPVLEAAAKYVDVASFNDYSIIPELATPLGNADPTYLPVDDSLAAQEAILGKPILISEWGYRAADSGLPNTWPPLFPVLQTQDQRAAAYESFVSGLLGTTYVVGQHFFEFADEPAAGRFDGEDSNFGLVDSSDNPYAPVVAISATMHDCAYARLLASPAPGPATTLPSPVILGGAGGVGSGPITSPVAIAAVPVAAEPRYTG